MRTNKWTVLGLGAVMAAGAAGLALAADAPATQPAGDGVKLELKLPKPRFEGTPKNLPAGVNLDKSQIGKKRPEFLVPAGAQLLSKGKSVTSSDPNPIIGTLDQITDGDKEATDGSFVELGFGTQWVQVDLGAAANIDAIVFWHRHNDVRIYRDVIVQVADDADFITNVRTLFNNDSDNSSGLGIGKDYEYIDDYQGKLVAGKSEKARYVRIYSKGSTADDQNHFTEVEVWGRQ